MVGVIAMILIAYSAINLRQGGASKSWPSVEGKITRAQIVPREVVRAKKQKVVLYDAAIAYSYTVAGHEYTSEKVRTDLQAQPHTAEAERLIELYPVGRSVTVHYNPANPDDSLLEPGSDPQTTSLLVCGIVLAVVAAIMGGVRCVRRWQ